MNDMNNQQLTQYRQSQVGFVFQFFNLISTLTAFENVALAAELANCSDRDTQKALESVGLSQRMHYFPNQLSGGEQQRVAIARALVKNSPLVLCDEPTGELDYETGIKILDLLRAMSRSTKKTFLLVTHNTEIGKIADRVIRLRGGKISEDKHNSKPISPLELRW